MGLQTTLFKIKVVPRMESRAAAISGLEPKAGEIFETRTTNPEGVPQCINHTLIVLVNVVSFNIHQMFD